MTQKDHFAWVKQLKDTWFGDADLNGLFDSNDMVQVFVVGKYETAEAPVGRKVIGLEMASSTPAIWSQPLSTVVTSGPRAGVVTVPEPSGELLLILGPCYLRECHRAAGHCLLLYSILHISYNHQLPHILHARRITMKRVTMLVVAATIFVTGFASAQPQIARGSSLPGTGN